MRNGGVVHQNVDRSVGVNRRADDAIDALFGGDVGLDSQRFEPLLAQGFQAALRLLDIGDHDLRTLLRELERDGEADAGCSPGDDRGFVFEFHFCSPGLDFEIDASNDRSQSIPLRSAASPGEDHRCSNSTRPP